MFDFSDPASLVNLIGLVVPLLVALLTRSSATQGLKSVLNFLLSAVLGSAAYLVSADGGYDFEGFANASLTTFVVSITSYYGLYKKTGVAGTIADKTSNFGIGSPPKAQTDDVGEEAGVEPVSTSTLDADVAQLWTAVEELRSERAVSAGDTEVIQGLSQQIASLQAEVERLEQTKSDRRVRGGLVR